MSERPTCTWDGERWTNGDEACNENHCAMRGRCPNHVQHGVGINTCAGCIRKARKDVAAIVELYALMAFDAQVDGVDSEAMNLLGRAAAPEQYSARRAREAALYERQGWCEWPRSEAFRPDDPHHPYSVLGRWDMAMRDQGWLPQSDLLVTVVNAAEGINHALDGGFPHGDEFEDFANQIRDCKAHLEAVDHDSHTPDLGRPCPTCADQRTEGDPKAPRLRKRYAVHPGLPPGMRCGAKDGSSGTVRPCRVCDGKDDAWHCPAFPEHAWTDDEYRRAVDADYIEHATALTAEQMRERFDVSRGSLSGWASRGEVRKAGKDQHGRQMYDVASVVAKLAAVAEGA